METKTPIEHTEAKAAQARLDAAKESLTHRFEELHRRFNQAKHKLSLTEQVQSRPWPAVGIALAVGALFGSFGGGRDRVPRLVEQKSAGGKLGEAVVGLLGTLAIKLIRELAVKQFGGVAKSWWDQQDRSATDSAKYAPPF